MGQIRMGVIGYGYWGPNLVRNLMQQGDETAVEWISDQDPRRLAQVKRMYPHVRTTQTYQELLTDHKVDAVVIATPTSTHFDIARSALQQGKHVLIEKPMTMGRKEADALVTIAKKKRKILMVDHTFVYTPAVREIASLMRSKKLGDIICIDAVRTNLGLFQRDTNVLYDLATHDFSILDYLLGGVLPVRVSATGTKAHGLHNQEAVADVVAHYPHGLYVHCHVSWLSPIKVRSMQIIGTKTMLVYEDTQSTEKIKVYDRGITLEPDPHDLYQRRIGYRLGSVITPYIPVEEGLAAMVDEFLSSIATGKSPITDGACGKRVVTIVEAATRSLRRGGAIVNLDVLR